jgi:uncharacterized NAD-dependent epimerase/dehydratase family protein
MESAIILTGDMFQSTNAKTAHGLVRGTERFDILGLIDSAAAGKKASEIIPLAQEIPIFADIDAFLKAHPEGAKWCIIGVATKGGVLPPVLMELVKTALSKGMNILNGLHQLLGDIPELKAQAEANKVEIKDIRRPKPFSELHFWNGDIQKVKCPIIPVLGTDCALGKRTSSRMLVQACQKQGIKAEMVYTGQTGWLQGVKHGFIFDATLNDFISGELEAAIVKCYEEENPDLIFVEGQSGLRNPSGPCGSEMLLSAKADAVILQVPAKRKKFKGLEDYPVNLPSAAEEIALISFYGVKTIALTINTQACTLQEALELKTQLEKELNIPVILPIEEGVDSLVPIVKQLIQQS